MERIKFHLLDVIYKIEGGKAVIHLFGRTLDGKQICVIDKKSQPYFVVLPKGDVKDAISAVVVDSAKVVKVEEFEKNILGVKKKHELGIIYMWDITYR